MPFAAITSINFNPAETYALGRLNRAQKQTEQSLEKLSTGKQINRASDDPSGLVAAEGLKSERNRVLKTLESYQQDLYRYNALDGGLAGVSDLLLGLQSNITQAANSGGLSDGERKALQLDTDALVGGIVQSVLTTRYKGEVLLQGYLGVGSSITGPDGQRVDAGALLQSFTSGGANNLLSGDLTKAQQAADTLVGSISSERAVLGGQINRIGSLSRALASQDENLAKALSGILDTDYAEQTGELIRSQIVEQASLSAVQLARDLQKDQVVDLLKSSVDSAKDALKAA